MKLYIDIETRSVVDVNKVGAYVYAEHPSTAVTVFCWALDDDPVQTWFPLESPMPVELAMALGDPTVTLCAHNVGFERTLLSGEPGRRIGCPDIADVDRWDDTAARAACMGLPRSLEGAGGALGLAVQKDAEGHRLMLALCKPRRGSTPDAPKWWDDPARMARLGEYCARDVEVERLIDQTLPPMPLPELEYWRTTERINDRGIYVDPDLLLALVFLTDDAEVALNDRISDATGGAVPRISDHGALTRWLIDQGIEEADEGVDKAHVAALLARDDLSPVIRSALQLRQDGGGSASKKFRAIMARMSRDGRVRGVLVYCGAEATGRWSSRGVQAQNMVRGGKLANVESAIRDVLTLYGGPAQPGALDLLEDVHAPPLILAAELTRPAFIARPGAWVARGDYSQIEARVIAWLAGAEWKLDAFRAYDAGTGPDLYRIGAGGIYRMDPAAVSGQQRQVGKVSELALGFQGGPGALQAMAKNYRLTIPRHEGNALDEAPEGTDRWIVQKWRAANPEISDREDGLWAQLEAAAIACMQAPAGQVFPVGPRGVRFKRSAAALGMRLPSGRTLFYWSPRLRMRMMPWGKERLAISYRGTDPVTKRWTVFDLYGGLLAQGLTQATAREIMAYALALMERRRMNPILTVHDEALAELLRRLFPTPEEAAAAVRAVMLDVPGWTAGLPVAADCSAGPRYVKA